MAKEEYVVDKYPVKHNKKLYRAGESIKLDEKEAAALGDRVIPKAEWDAKKDAQKAITDVKTLQELAAKQEKEIEKLKGENEKLKGEIKTLKDELKKKGGSNGDN